MLSPFKYLWTSTICSVTLDKANFYIFSLHDSPLFLLKIEDPLLYVNTSQVNLLKMRYNIQSEAK